VCESASVSTNSRAHSFTGNTVFGPHDGEAMAVSGARNRITGNDLADSTGAAGPLLWCGKAHEQSNADTIVTGNLIHDKHPIRASQSSQPRTES
jgi:hypothetical protein